MTTGSTIARFTITLSKSVTEPVQVAWSTKDGTAKAGIDYAAASGIAVFSPGETSKDVDVLVYGRAVGTEDRNFFLEMTPPPNAIFGESIGECVIYLDTAGNTAVIQVIVPTGPQGAKGDSAYQSWLNLGNTGTEQDFINSLSPPIEEIAEEVAPILNVGSSPLTAADTSELSNPDNMTVSELARRVAYVGATKVATVVLEAGDNLISTSDLSGDDIDFYSFGLAVRIMRGPSILSPEWSLESDGRLLVKAAAAGDVLYVCDYDMMSKHAFNKAISGAGGAGLVGPGVMARGGDRFSIMQGRSGEHRQDTLTRGLAIELNEPITGSGFAGATNTYMFNRLYIKDDKVDAVTDGTPGTKVDGLIVQHQFGGAGTRGGRHAAEFMLTQQGATEPDNTDRNYVGVVGYCASTAGDGGTDMSAGKKGAYFGGNFFTTIKNSQFVSHANGCESNVLIDAASSVYYRSGYSAVSAGDNQATKYDAAFSVGALGAVGAQWLDGLLVGVQNGRNPVSRSIIRGESASMQSLASFSGTIPGGLIVSDTDDRFNFRIDRLEMHYANASLKLGAKTAVNTPFIDAYTDATGNRAGRIIFTGTAPTADNGVCNVQFRQTTVKEIVPSSPNAYSCGTASLPWSGIFTQTAPTITSDENYKTKPLAITDAMLDAASEVDWVQYQYLDRVEAKGPDGARWHFGAIAQRFIEAFNRHGLDAHDYGFLCYDEWDDQWGKVITNEGATITKTRTVQCPVVETVIREIPVYTEQEDGSVVVTMTSREALVPKLEKAFLYNEDGTPRMNDDGNHAYELFEVMVDVEEEYTEPAEPEYEDVLEIPAGSRYGIRYEEALALEAALQRRERKRDREAFEVFKSEVLVRLQKLEA